MGRAAVLHPRGSYHTQPTTDAIARLVVADALPHFRSLIHEHEKARFVF